MKTAVFPFTCLSHPILTAMQTLFGVVTVYQPLSGAVPDPMKKWGADGRLRLCLPAAGNESELGKALREYRQWMEPDPGTRLASLSLLSKPPDDAPAFQIRDEIRHRIRGKESAPAADPLFAARLFLALAQVHDLRQMEIAADWARLQTMETRLFDTLHGRDALPGAEEETAPSGIGARATVLVAERLRAWSWLMLQDDPLPALYVTTAREAFERIIADTSPAECLPGFHAAAFPFNAGDAARELMPYLESIAASEQPLQTAPRFPLPEHPGSRRVELTLAVAPDTPPGSIFSRYASPAAQPSDNRANGRHTLLALVEGAPTEI